MDRTGPSTRNLFTSAISLHIVEESAVELLFDRRSHRRKSDRTSQRFDPFLVSNVAHKETQALVLDCLVHDLDDCYRFCTIHCDYLSSSLLLTSQHPLVLVTLVHALSVVLDDFLLRLLGVSLSGLVLGVQVLGALRTLRGALCCFLQRHIFQFRV